ncbi:hypothetical protein ACCO45_001172 [Purpureocillium lilacinum]|uniref:Uncharacterized protein n=1 Tax=Purpureocillium lilacinum TaxID=33203 RepID=A0ACC4E756_PURLI
MAPTSSELAKRYYCNGYGYCYNSRWYDWGRWVVVGAIIFFCLLILLSCTCVARRRRRRGAQPMYGTGWMAPAGKRATTSRAMTSSSTSKAGTSRPATPTPPPAYGQQHPQYTGTTFNPNDGYYGQQQGQQYGVQQPAHTYQREGNFSPPRDRLPANHELRRTSRPRGAARADATHEVDKTVALGNAIVGRHKPSPDPHDAIAPQAGTGPPPPTSSTWRPQKFLPFLNSGSLLGNDERRQALLFSAGQVGQRIPIREGAAGSTFGSLSSALGRGWMDEPSHSFHHDPGVRHSLDGAGPLAICPSRLLAPTRRSRASPILVPPEVTRSTKGRVGATEDDFRSLSRLDNVLVPSFASSRRLDITLSTSRHSFRPRSRPRGFYAARIPRPFFHTDSHTTVGQTSPERRDRSFTSSDHENYLALPFQTTNLRLDPRRRRYGEENLRGGVLDQLKDVVARAVVAGLSRRDIISDAQGKVTDVKTAFSSWDNCMKASFCKWPVIAVIVVGGLILLGIAWCIIRCYQQQTPMQAPFPPATSKHPVYEPPQYAEFDVSKKGSEDALPHMPSWEGAGSKKVVLEEEEMEMNQLKKSPNSTPAQPPLASPSTGPVSPMGMNGHSPYDNPRGGPNGYMPNQSQQALGHGRLSPGQSQQNLGAYSQGQPGYNNVAANRESGFGLDQPYDDPALGGTPGQHPPASGYMANAQNQAYVPPVIAGMGQGRQSPAPGRHMNQGYAEMPAEAGHMNEYGQRSPQDAQSGYGMRRQNTGDNGAVAGSRPPYGMDPRMRNSPGPRRTPGPRNDNALRDPRYGSPAPMNRTYSPAPPPDRHFSPAPERQLSPAPGRHRGQDHRPPPLARPPISPGFAQSPPQSPIRNNSGFDFTSGYARPENSERRPNEPKQSPTQEAYPGYKPYQPAQ